MIAFILFSCLFVLVLALCCLSHYQMASAMCRDKEE